MDPNGGWAVVVPRTRGADVPEPGRTCQSPRMISKEQSYARPHRTPAVSWDVVDRSGFRLWPVAREYMGHFR